MQQPHNRYKEVSCGRKSQQQHTIDKEKLHHTPYTRHQQYHHRCEVRTCAKTGQHQHMYGIGKLQNTGKQRLQDINCLQRPNTVERTEHRNTTHKI